MTTTPITTSPTATIPTTNAPLQTEWAARLARGEFSPAVVGVGTLRVMGASGDEALAFPQISSLAALDQLAPDERWAIEQVELVVSVKQRGRRLATIKPGTGMGAIVDRFDPTALDDYLLLIQSQGG